MSTRVIVIAFFAVLSGGGASWAIAQSSISSPNASASSLQPWKASDETSVGGVIREVLTKKPMGAPIGLSFVMTGSQHTLTVNVGRDLDPQVRDLVKAGETVRVTGVVRAFGGEDYLLAREMVIGGKTIELRTANGFPMHGSVKGALQSKRVGSEGQGGAR
jgi:hypothetical protein